MIWTGALTPDVEFQSTLSSRRATPPGRGGFGHGNDFNPRSPHGERLQFQFCPVARINFNPRSPHGERRSPVIGTDPSAIISIHALLTESDDAVAQAYREEAISIHALLTESDCGVSVSPFLRSDFNPRSPHGERLVPSIILVRSSCDFNPRSPHGERPTPAIASQSAYYISIHALLTESDRRFPR